MGAWDTGIFDDDTAYEFTTEIVADAKTFFKNAFQKAIEADYLEHDDCHAITVSAAYMDNLLNGTTYRTDNKDENDLSNVNNFRQLRPNLKVNDLQPLAIKALQKVLLEEKSELCELWAENEEYFPKWKATIDGLIVRLSSL